MRVGCLDTHANDAHTNPPSEAAHGEQVCQDLDADGEGRDEGVLKLVTHVVGQPAEQG
jgi:hypothetical protein